MIDLVIAAVLLLCAVMGWRRGLFRSLAELAAMLLALVLSAQIANVAAPIAVDRFLRPATHAAIAQRVDELAAEGSLAASPLEGLEAAVEAIPNGFVRSRAQDLLEGLDLPAREEALGEAARDALVGMGTQVADTVLDTMAYRLLHSMVCAASFLVLSFLLRLAVRALGLVMKLPVLRQLNEAGGLLVGVGKGVLLVFLGVWVLGRTGVLSPEMAEGSWLLAPIAEWTGASAGTL